MQTVNKFTMLQLAVSDMQKAKELYADKLGLKITADYKQDENNWWVSLELPEGGVTITLTTHHAHMKPGTQTLYFATSDIEASHKKLTDEGVTVGEVQNDLHGPGSNVKFFMFNDTEGNLVHIEQA